jgi:hypothetical protein
VARPCRTTGSLVAENLEGLADYAHGGLNFGAPRPFRPRPGPTARPKWAARPSPAWRIPCSSAAASFRRVSAHSGDGPSRGTTMPARSAPAAPTPIAPLRSGACGSSSGHSGAHPVGAKGSESDAAAALTGSWGRERGSRADPSWRSAMTQSASRGPDRARPAKDRGSVPPHCSSMFVPLRRCSGRNRWKPWNSRLLSISSAG